MTLRKSTQIVLLMAGFLNLKIWSSNQVFAQEDFPQPVVFLPLNKDYTTKDLSKNNFTTTDFGVTLSSDIATDGQTDGSYYFPGSASGYIEIPQDPKLDIRYSMSFFIWLNVIAQYGPIINFETDTSEYGLHSFVHIKNGAPFFFMSLINRNNPVNDYTHIEEPIPTNTWTYVGFTYDYSLGQLKYYKDGVFIKEIRNNWKVELKTQHRLKIGGKKFHHPDYKAMKGRLACLQIYKEVLTPEQVKESQELCSRNEFRPCFHYKSGLVSNRELIKKTMDILPDSKVISRIHWYRFKEKKIRSSCHEPNSCGTQFPGWLNGQYPSREDGIKKMEICYRSGSNCCASKGSVLVRQCYGYHVFKFDDFPAQGRFCTEQDQQSDNIMFMSTNERRLPGRVFRNISDVTDPSKCIDFCLSVGHNCKSVNFINEGNGKCQLNTATQSDASLIEDNKCIYYDRL